MSNPTLEVICITYGNQTVQLGNVPLFVGNIPIIYTRKEIAAWLQISPDELDAITRQPRGHFSIGFDSRQQQFFVEKPYDPKMKLNGRFINDYSFLHSGQNSLSFKANRRNAQITIELRCLGDTIPTSSGTKTLPVEGSVYQDDNWDWLITSLKTKRSAHIWGLPGVGKSYLLHHLLHDNTFSRELRAKEGLPNLIGIPINGKAIMEDQTDYPLWYKLLYKMISELEVACDRYGLESEITSKVSQIISSMDSHHSPKKMRSARFNAYLTKAIILLTQRRFFVTFICDNFDKIYTELPSNILTTLHDLHKRNNDLALILVTYAPLAQLRSPIDALSHLFTRVNLQIKRFSPTHLSDKLPDLLPDVSQHVLPVSVIDTLYALTGGHPKIIKHVWEELKTQKTSTTPAMWLNTLQNISKSSNLFLAFLEIWYTLQPKDQETILKIVRQQRISPNETSRLQSINILNENGSLFSPVIDRCILLLHAGTADELTVIKDKKTGTIDVLIGNIPKTDDVKGQGIPLQILALLYESETKTCSVEYLIKTVWGYQSVSTSRKDTLRKHVDRTNKRLTGEDTLQYIVKVKGKSGAEYRLYTQPQPKPRKV